MYLFLRTFHCEHVGKISQKFTRATLLREKLPEAKHSAEISGKSDLSRAVRGKLPERENIVPISSNVVQLV